MEAALRGIFVGAPLGSLDEVRVRALIEDLVSLRCGNLIEKLVKEGKKKRASGGLADFEAELRLGRAIADFVTLHEASGALDVDVYEVGQHGSDNGTTAPQLVAMTPRVALIAAGPPARQFPFSARAHGHPRRVVLELATSRDVEGGTGAKKFAPISLTQAIYVSGWDGAIVVDLPGAGAPPTVTATMSTGRDIVGVP